MLGTLSGLLLSSYDKVGGARFTKFNSQAPVEHRPYARCWGCKDDIDGRALTSWG